jgi:HNH endonuclease
MGFAPDRLEQVFGKNAGNCDYCGKQLAWTNYGRPGYRGAWEVDHSLPISRGGTNHLNNLVPTCVPCNQTKSDMTGTEFRRSLAASEPTGPDWGKIALVGLGLLALRALLKNGSSLSSPSFDPLNQPPRWP